MGPVARHLPRRQHAPPLTTHHQHAPQPRAEDGRGGAQERTEPGIRQQKKLPWSDAAIARARAALLRHLPGTQALVTTYGHQVSTVILFIYFVFVNSFPM